MHFDCIKPAQRSATQRNLMQYTDNTPVYVICLERKCIENCYIHMMRTLHNITRLKRRDAFTR